MVDTNMNRIMPGTSIVTCLGIIMDGNRRWARTKGLPTLEGHRKGYEKLKEVVRWAQSASIPHLVVYLFSTENWQRSKEEVDYLMRLLRSVLENETEKMIAERISVSFVGDRTRFGSDMRDQMEKMEAATAKEYDLTLHLLLSYGGRAEIAAAARAAAAEGEVTETSLAKHLWTSGMPDPDLIIRTSGEQRLSNFLPWQSTYSEFFFTKTLWPDFSKREFDDMLTAFASRERRHGR